MAYEENLQKITLPASADLSAGQFRAVVIDASGEIALAGADTFVAGSAIFGANDLKTAIDGMRGELAQANPR